MLPPPSLDPESTDFDLGAARDRWARECSGEGGCSCASFIQFGNATSSLRTLGKQYAQMHVNCNDCPEYLAGAACMKGSSDCHKGIDKLEDSMFRENPLSKWYAGAWPFIIAFRRGCPDSSVWRDTWDSRSHILG